MVDFMKSGNISPEEARRVEASVTRGVTTKEQGGVTNSVTEPPLAQQIRDWVETTTGWFNTTTCDKELNILSKSGKANRRMAFKRLVDGNILQRHPSRDGVFRRIEKLATKIDLSQSIPESNGITLPLGLNELVKIYDGNIILLAGEKDAGKTSYCLNIAADNMVTHEIHYFNCEMGVEELTNRLYEFNDVDFRDWQHYVNFYERSSNFADLIVPGKKVINIIDYMAIYENHFLIGQWIKDIHEKLNGAIAVIAVQKPGGRDEAVGGGVTLDIPRLYLAMSRGKMKIVSAKNRKNRAVNPNGMVIHFKLVAGAKFIQIDRWSIPEEEK